MVTRIDAVRFIALPTYSRFCPLNGEILLNISEEKMKNSHFYETDPASRIQGLHSFRHCCRETKRATRGATHTVRECLALIY